MRTIAIDAWNQCGIDEVSLTLRNAASGAERNDATLKVATLEVVPRETRRAMGFAQNARDEVRMLGGDGSAVCTVSAAAGTHQTNYLCEIGNYNQDHSERKYNTMLKAEVRRLTVLECERLMGFPDGHTEPMGSESNRYSGCGNSWAVNNASVVMDGIHRVDERLVGERRQLRYGTISSGVEAHSLAARRHGDKAVFFSEISPAPCKVLAARHPDVPNLGDMTLVDYDSDGGCIHNRPYDGYVPVSKDVLGFEPYRTPEPVEIKCGKGEVDLVSGGTPCWTKGAYVLTERGYVPIEEVKAGDLVVTHLGRLRKVLRVGRKSADNIVEVRAYGRPLFKVTADHKFLTFDKGSPVFKSVTDIGVKGDICIPRDGFACDDSGAIPQIPKFDGLSEDCSVLELAGWYVAAGYMAGDEMRLSLGKAHSKAFVGRFGDKVKHTIEVGENFAKIVRIEDKELAKWMADNFGARFADKTIPAWVVGAGAEQRQSFVDGYFAVNGYKNAEGILGVTSTVPSVAYGLSSVWPQSSVGHFVNAERRAGTYYVRRDANPKESVKRHIRCGSGYDLIRIASITPVDGEEVYNIEVEEDHSYVCNGMMSSNCQDLSVAGKRKGGAEGSDTRSSLAFQLPRIGSAVGAKWIVWENVAGAFSSNGGRDFAWLIHRMTDYGYRAIAWRCMDAQYCRTQEHPRAVPQRRRRVWIVGYRGDDWRIPCEALFSPIRALGTKPPVRTSGVGFTKPCRCDDAVGYIKKPLEEFRTFVELSDRGIIELLERSGVCQTVAERERSLAESETDANDGYSDDLFAAMEEPVHQGRNLCRADLNLRMPEEPSIRNVPPTELFGWAKTVCSDVLYCGELFQNWKRQGASKVATEEKTVDTLCEQMLSNIGNAGFLCDGLVCTMKMPEWNAGVTKEDLADMDPQVAALYDGDVCGLSDVLEDDADSKFKLSWRACYGVLRRAKKRGKKIPIELGVAMVERIVEQSPYIKWVAENGKATVKKEGDVSERDLAKGVFDEFVSPFRKWDDVTSEDPENVRHVEDPWADSGDGEEPDEGGEDREDGE